MKAYKYCTTDDLKTTFQILGEINEEEMSKIDKNSTAIVRGGIAQELQRREDERYRLENYKG